MLHQRLPRFHLHQVEIHLHLGDPGNLRQFHLEYLGNHLDQGCLVSPEHPECLGYLEHLVQQYQMRLHPEYLRYLEYPVPPACLADPERLGFLERPEVLVHLEFPVRLVHLERPEYPAILDCQYLQWFLVLLEFPGCLERLEYLAIQLFPEDQLRLVDL